MSGKCRLACSRCFVQVRHAAPSHLVWKTEHCLASPPLSLANADGDLDKRYSACSLSEGVGHVGAGLLVSNTTPGHIVPVASQRSAADWRRWSKSHHCSAASQPLTNQLAYAQLNLCHSLWMEEIVSALSIWLMPDQRQEPMPCGMHTAQPMATLDPCQTPSTHFKAVY